jgi:hypothetical protein
LRSEVGQQRPCTYFGVTPLVEGRVKERNASFRSQSLAPNRVVSGGSLNPSLRAIADRVEGGTNR